MNELKVLNDGFKVAMTSLQVADVTGKQHSHVMRDIKDEISKLGAEISESLFEMSEYRGTRRLEKCYNLSRDGVFHMAKRWKWITKERMNKLGIEDAEVIHTSTRFEISFKNLLTEALNEIGLELIEQHNVDGYRVDFYIDALNVAIEYDEKQHYTVENQKNDSERQRYIEYKLGCKFIRCDYRDSDIKNVMKVLKEVM